MKRSILFTFLLACSPAIAAADTITLPPGLWSYQGTAQMGLARLDDAGTQCMRPGQSTYDLNKVAASIAPGCALTGATSLGNGVAFSVMCTGSVKGELDGTFQFTDTSASLTAKGWTGDPGAPVDLSVAASADRVSDTCS